jgi:hypothetical protein
LKERSRVGLPPDEFPAWWRDKYTSATLLSKTAPLNPLLLQIQGNAPFSIPILLHYLQYGNVPLLA